MSDLVLERVPDAVLARELALSPHATAFNQPSTLAALAERVEWWGVRRGPHWLLLWPQCRDADGAQVDPVFAYYLGPLYTAGLLADSPSGQLRALGPAWTLALRTLLERDRMLSAALPLGMDDVRPLVWAAAELGLDLDLKPRYTAVLDDLQAGLPTLAAGFSRSRERAIRTGEGLSLIRGPVSAEEVLRLYAQPFQRQGQSLDPARLEQLGRMVALASGPEGITLGYHRRGETSLVGAAVLLGHRDTVNNVLCIADTSLRDHGATAWITREAIRAAIERGARVFDFNGANTPDRALDKALYGTRTRLYFRFELRRSG